MARIQETVESLGAFGGEGQNPTQRYRIKPVQVAECVEVKERLDVLQIEIDRQRGNGFPGCASRQIIRGKVSRIERLDAIVRASRA